MSKYEPLADHLAGITTGRIAMSFKEIEALLGGPLPASAYAHAAWWSNTGGSHVQAQAWLATGFRTAEVDIQAGRLTFIRERPVVAPAPQPSAPKPQRRHPAIGAMRGMITLTPGVDLTAPVDPEWIDRLWDGNDTAGDIVGGLDDPIPDPEDDR